MDDDLMLAEKTKINALVLSNLVAIVTKTIIKVSGNEISNHLNNELINSEIVSSLVLKRINSNLVKEGVV